jgi:hypothetical protein
MMKEFYRGFNMASNFYFHRFKSGEVFGATVQTGATSYHAIDNGRGGYSICSSVKGGGMGPMFASMPLETPLTAEAILAAVKDAEDAIATKASRDG